MDCYTDPLGWKDKIRKSGNVKDLTGQSSLISSPYKTVKDLDKLFPVITELGRGILFRLFCTLTNLSPKILSLNQINTVVLINGFYALLL